MSVQFPVLRYADSFDHYGTGSDTTLLMAKKWNGVSASVVSTGGRTGLCATLGLLRKTLTYEQRWTAGWGFKIVGLTGGNFGAGSLYDLNAVSVGHVFASLYSVRIEPDGAVAVYSGNVLGGTSNPFVLHQGVWYYFETEVSLSTHTLSATKYVAAEGTVYLDGYPIIQSGNIFSDITLAGLLRGEAEADAHTFGGASVGQSYIDDVYIANFASGTATGTPNYYGPIKILAVYPATDVTTEWQTSSGSVHYSLIDQTSTTGTSVVETNYIYNSNTASATDEWVFQPISTFVGTICGIQYSLYAKKDDFGVRLISHKFGTATASITGTDIGTSLVDALADDYYYHHVPLDYNPDDETVWTPASFNTHTFGVVLQTNTVIAGT